MHFVAVDDQVGDGSFRVGAVDRDAEPVAAAARGVTTGKGIFDVMDVVFEKFDVGAGSGNADAKWSGAMLGGVKVADFEALDSDVTLIVNRENAGPGVGCETSCVQNRRFSVIARDGDVSVGRISGCIDTDELFVNSSANVDGAAGAGFVDGALDRAPRRGFGAGI